MRLESSAKIQSSNYEIQRIMALNRSNRAKQRIEKRDSTGHKGVYQSYVDSRKTNKDGINLGKAEKYSFLKQAAKLKELLAGGNGTEQTALEVGQKELLNAYIKHIQRNLNNGALNVNRISGALRHELNPDGYLGMYTADAHDPVVDFVNTVAKLAKHNTTANTKFNWFGLNTTSHIELLLNDKKCNRYLDEHALDYTNYPA